MKRRLHETRKSHYQNRLLPVFCCPACRDDGERPGAREPQGEKIPHQTVGDRRPGQLLHRWRAQSHQVCHDTAPGQPQPNGGQSRPDHDRPDVCAVPGPGGLEPRPDEGRKVAGDHGARVHPHGSLSRVDAGRAGGLGALFRAPRLPGVRGRSGGTGTLGVRRVCHRRGRGDGQRR